MITCSCGELVEDHVRYHWTSNDSGHYVVDEAPKAAAQLARAQKNLTAPQLTLPDPRGLEPWQTAPPPGKKPPKRSWVLEDVLRWSAIDLLCKLGLSAHNLEQGYRPDGGHTRVSKGLPDVYFHGRLKGVSVRGWMETKRWDNTQSPEQMRFEADELAAGGIYLLIYELEQIHGWYRTFTQAIP